LLLRSSFHIVQTLEQPLCRMRLCCRIAAHRLIACVALAGGSCATSACCALCRQCCCSAGLEPGW
jgi:hypothetical protein